MRWLAIISSVTLAACSSERAAPARVARDFNGDGVDDFAIGLLPDAARKGEDGRVRIYLGNRAGELEAAGELSAELPHSRFGSSVTPVGDLNGDGFADLAVGARGLAPAHGRAYVYFGGSEGIDAAPDGRLGEAEQTVAFGDEVARAGDLNGDGYGDLAVSAWPPGVAGGRVWIYFGGPGETFDPSADVILSGGGLTRQRGRSVAGVGDVNGDGYGDLAVTAVPAFSPAAVFLYLGGPSFDGEADFTLHGDSNDLGFGMSVAGAGDLNGDGLADLAVSNAPIFGGPRLYFFLGRRDGLERPDASYQATPQQGGLGGALEGELDLDGDGLSDFVVGAPQSASALVFFGDGDFTGELGATLRPGDSGFGLDGASLGDFNQDGRDDLFVASRPTTPSGLLAKGSVFFGGGAQQLGEAADRELLGEVGFAFKGQ